MILINPLTGEVIKDIDPDELRNRGMLPGFTDAEGMTTEQWIALVERLRKRLDFHSGPWY